jgi:hypothetical protein
MEDEARNELVEWCEREVKAWDALSPAAKLRVRARRNAENAGFVVSTQGAEWCARRGSPNPTRCPRRLI